jgi:dodecin
LRSRTAGRSAAASFDEGADMSSVARVTEISAISEQSFEDAIRVGVDRASQTLRNLQSAWVKEQEVQITNGAISGYKVNLEVTFVLE